MLTPPAGASRCERLLGTSFILSDGDEVFVRPSDWSLPNAHVTGERQFPLETVRFALDLEFNSVRGLRTLSIGEGWSGLLPALRSHGADAVAVDLWYGARAFPLFRTGRELSEYVDRQRSCLIAASGHALPFADDSFDLVLSHFLLHHLRIDAYAGDPDPKTPAVLFLKEAGRVLKPGGRAVITQCGSPAEERPGLEEHLRLALNPELFGWRIEEDAVTITDLRNQEPLRIDIMRVTITRK